VIRPDAPVLLEIRDLHARVEDKAILKGVNLTIRAGEIHAVMGRNSAPALVCFWVSSIRLKFQG
jgi:Fe-S cluster assembly ATP-binding protein